MAPDGSPRDGSRLCLACGLCCRGVLHDYVGLEGGELEAAGRLGLPVFRREGCAGFDLPCPRHVGGRCTVYPERPSTCRGYRCKLLKRYLAGEVEFEEAMVQVERVQGLVERLGERLGPGAAGASVWARLRALETAPAGGTPAAPLDPDTALDVATLLALCRRHFKNHPQAVKVTVS